MRGTVDVRGGVATAPGSVAGQAAQAEPPASRCDDGLATRSIRLVAVAPGPLSLTARLPHPLVGSHHTRVRVGSSSRCRRGAPRLGKGKKAAPNLTFQFRAKTSEADSQDLAPKRVTQRRRHAKTWHSSLAAITHQSEARHAGVSAGKGHGRTSLSRKSVAGRGHCACREDPWMQRCAARLGAWFLATYCCRARFGRCADSQSHTFRGRNQSGWGVPPWSRSLEY